MQPTTDLKQSPECEVGAKAHVRPLPLVDRIRYAWSPGIRYYDLMRAAFPTDEFPDAFRTPNRGGPPGCAMAFGAALRRMGAWEGPYPERVIVLPNPRESTT